MDQNSGEDLDGGIELEEITEKAQNDELDRVNVIIRDRSGQAHTVSYSVLDTKLADQAYGNDGTGAEFDFHEFPSNRIFSRQEDEILEIRKKAWELLDKKGYRISAKDSGVSFGTD